MASKHLRQHRPRLADQDRGVGACRRDGSQRGEVHSLVAASGDEHERPREGLQRGHHGIGLGPLRIVDELDAVHRRDSLEAMLHPGEPGGRTADGVRRHTEEQGNGHRGQGVRDVVQSRDCQFGDGHDPASRAHLRLASAGRRQARHGRGHDPALLQAESPGGGAAPAVGHDRRTPVRGIRRHDRVVGIDHQRALAVDELGQAALHRPVRLQAAVAVEVVGRDVGVDGDRGPATGSAAAARRAR